jgi:hypothetical protein
MSPNININIDGTNLRFEETKKTFAMEEECFLLTTQQYDQNLPYQESINSYNTADFTKFSIGELSRSNQKNNIQI